MEAQKSKRGNRSRNDGKRRFMSSNPGCSKSGDREPVAEGLSMGCAYGRLSFRLPDDRVQGHGHSRGKNDEWIDRWKRENRFVDGWINRNGYNDGSSAFGSWELSDGEVPRSYFCWLQLPRRSLPKILAMTSDMATNSTTSFYRRLRCPAASRLGPCGKVSECVAARS